MNSINFETESIITKYIDRIICQSKPDAPLWNIESIKQGKKPSWNYIDGCMITGLLNLYAQSKEQKYLDFVKKFVDFYVDENGKILGYDPSEYNIDNISAGRNLFDLYQIFGDQKYKKAIELIYSQIKTHPRNCFDSFWHKKIYPNQVWLDGLYMAQVFYTRYETQFNNCKNYADIAKQFENVANLMFDNAKKLFYHGLDASKKAFWADPKTGLSKNFWLRSEGWFLCALCDVLEYLDPAATHIKVRLTQILKQALDGILGYIDQKEKMFFQVIDRGSDKGNYLETSGSAMVSYSALKATRLGVGDYAQIGAQIFEGICQKYLSQTNGDLHLGGICLVAGLGPDNNLRRDGSYAYYISEPVVNDDAKGLGPFLNAFAELKRTTPQD